jgi:hypothetical protein
MSGLLPHAVQHAVSEKTVLSASQSFALISLTILIVLLVEREALRVVRAEPARVISLSIACLPLLVVVGLTLLARVAQVVG